MRSPLIAAMVLAGLAPAVQAQNATFTFDTAQPAGQLPKTDPSQSPGWRGPTHPVGHGDIEPKAGIDGMKSMDAAKPRGIDSDIY